MKRSEIAQIMENLKEFECWTGSFDNFDYLIGIKPPTVKSSSRKGKDYVFVRFFQKKRELVKLFTKAEDVINDIYCESFNPLDPSTAAKHLFPRPGHITTNVPIPTPPMRNPGSSPLMEGTDPLIAVNTLNNILSELGTYIYGYGECKDYAYLLCQPTPAEREYAPKKGLYALIRFNKTEMLTVHFNRSEEVQPYIFCKSMDILQFNEPFDVAMERVYEKSAKQFKNRVRKPVAVH